MPQIPLTEFIDKTLYAKKNVPIILNPLGEDKKQIAIAQAGNPIGVVYSWLGGQSGKPLYFMFYSPAPQNKPYYVEYKPGAFNYEMLREQGLQTTQEIQKEKEEAAKGTGEKALDFVKKYALWAGIVYTGYLFYKAYQSKK